MLSLCMAVMLCTLLYYARRTVPITMCLSCCGHHYLSVIARTEHGCHCVPVIARTKDGNTDSSHNHVSVLLLRAALHKSLPYPING